MVCVPTLIFKFDSSASKLTSHLLHRGVAFWEIYLERISVVNSAFLEQAEWKMYGIPKRRQCHGHACRGSNRKCKQVVTVIWHKAALLPHTDCSVIFARSREYAPPHLTHASFGPRKSTTQTVSWSVQPFLHRLRLSVIGHVRTCPFTVKIAPSDGGSGAPSNAWFLGSSQLSTPNSISIVFAQLTADSPYTLQWAPLSPKNCPFSWGDLYPHLIHGYFGSPKSSTQTASQSVKPCRAHYGDRSTDHATWSVTMGHNDDLFAPHKFVLTHHMHNEVYWTFIEYFRVYFCRHC